MFQVALFSLPGPRAYSCTMVCCIPREMLAYWRHPMDPCACSRSRVHQSLEPYVHCIFLLTYLTLVPMHLCFSHSISSRAPKHL